MEVAGEMQLVKDPESRRANLNYLARYIEDALSSRPTYSDASCAGRCRRCLARCCCLWFGRRYGNYLVTLYLLVKGLYIVNITGQFFLMNRYLGTNYTMYGLDLLRDIAEGHMWQESGNFPRITLCDFEIRRLGNVHRHTVQCVLPINMFNEKIYIFLWFWMAVVAVLAVTSFFVWLVRCTIPMARTRFIRKYLKLRNLLTMGDRRRSLAFVDSFLRQDGVFIVRLIAQNAGELAAAELVERLWLTFKHRPVGLLTSPSNTDPDSKLPPSAPQRSLLTANTHHSGVGGGGGAPLLGGPGEMGLNAASGAATAVATKQRRFINPGSGGGQQQTGGTKTATAAVNRKRNGGGTDDDPGEFV